MSGTSIAPFVIPVVVLPVLAGWLMAVYHANKHPRWFSSKPDSDKAEGTSALPPGEP
jgi:hypothetical protein